MMKIIAFLFIGYCSAVLLEQHFSEANPCVTAQTCGQSDFKLQGEAKLAHAHSATFAIKRKNIEFLKSHLAVLSDLNSPFYGKWFTADEVHKLTDFPEATKAVKAWLRKAGLKVTSTRTGDYLTATGTVKQFADLLATKFFIYYSPVAKRSINRALYTNVPSEISQYLDFIHGIVDFPATLAPRTKIEQFEHLEANGQVTPSLIHSYYKITPSKVTNMKATQAVFESLGQSYSPKDLATFENKFNIPAQKIKKVIGPNSPSDCEADPNACVEASLDVQYIIGVAPGAPTTFWSIPGFGSIFLNWAKQVMNAQNPPLVHSISYGSIEKEEDPAQLRRFDSDLMTLGTRGLTVFVATGDDGVANFIARNDRARCGFSPSFPATSPHVVAVGATQGPEYGMPEIACSSKTGGLITSGGGFSTVFSRPAFQNTAVENYLKNGPNLPPTNMFNSKGRGYPDISMVGHNYVVALAGRFYIVSGTSCSTPVSAAVATFINSARMTAGKSSLGYITPTFYSGNNGSKMFKDITKGENNCCAGQKGFEVCCQYGFTCSKGWDPVTGFGSIKYAEYSKVFMKK